MISAKGIMHEEAKSNADVPYGSQGIEFSKFCKIILSLIK
jgi:hypothetical protein